MWILKRIHSNIEKSIIYIPFSKTGFVNTRFRLGRADRPNAYLLPTVIYSISFFIFKATEFRTLKSFVS